VKSFARSIVGSVMSGSGLMHRNLRQTGVIVAYHRVNDRTAGDALTRSTRDYESFGRFFRDYFDVVSLGDFVGRLAAGRSVEGLLSITHDDGYLDNYQHAAPILQKLGLPGTFFVSTHFLESDTVPWWDQEVTEPLGWMSWDQVREMQAMGFEIGSHTCTHADLGAVDAEVARHELVQSRLELERELSHPIDLFAYPYGGVKNMTDANLALVKEAGYRCSVSCCGGVVRDGDDPFRLLRIPISAWYTSPMQLAMELGLGRA